MMRNHITTNPYAPSNICVLGIPNEDGELTAKTRGTGEKRISAEGVIAKV